MRSFLRRIFVLFLISGCGMLASCASKSGDAITLFDLGLVRANPEGRALPVLAGVSVAEVSATGGLDSPFMYYRLAYANDQQPHRYASSRWTMPPTRLFGQRLKSRIVQAGGVAVTATDSAVNVPMLRIEADEFTQVFDSPGQSSARLAIRASFYHGRVLVAQKTFYKQVPAPTADAAGGAKALALATDAVIDDLIIWLAGLPPKNNDSSESCPDPDCLDFSRAALAVYSLLIIYASLYPFSGWHDLGLSLESYMFAPLPRYWTFFDVSMNVVSYVPFGILMIFALHPGLRGGLAVVVAIIAGIVLSCTMETLQTYLPNRVPSNLDLLTNVVGTCIGAIVGALSRHTFLERSQLVLMRRRWFSPEASRGLIVLALWPVAQIYPQSYLFGHGQVLPIISGWLTSLLSAPVDLSGEILDYAALTVEQSWLAETIVTACGLTGAMLTLLCLLLPNAPRWGLLAVLAAGAFLSKLLSSALLAPENTFVWWTPGAQGGVVIGILMLAGLAFAPPVAQRRVAALALITSLIVVNMVPTNPYFLSTMQDWVQGKFLNFNGAAQFLALLWPFFTIWYLLHPIHRIKPAVT